MPIAVDVVTQEEKLFSEPEADSVLVPGVDGQLGILPRHTPLITMLDYGELVVRKGNAEERFAVFGGVLEVRPDKVVVLADAADFAAEVSIEEAEEARRRVQAILEEGVPPEDHALYAAELRRAELSVKIARRVQSGAGSVRIKVLQEEDNE